MSRGHIQHLVIIGGNILLSLILLFVFISSSSRPVTASKPTAVLGKTSYNAPLYTDKSVQNTADLVNQTRVSNGLLPLSQNPELDAIATIRAQDMETQSYYAHKSPNGTMFNDIMNSKGMTYTYACENLNIYTSSDPTYFVNSWLASTMGHKECMLKTGNASAGYSVATIHTKSGIAIDETVIVAIYSD